MGTRSPLNKNTGVLEVQGMFLGANTPTPEFANVQVRFTSDKRGETISLACNDMQITVPFEQVRGLIADVRNPRKSNN